MLFLVGYFMKQLLKMGQGWLPAAKSADFALLTAMRIDRRVLT